MPLDVAVARHIRSGSSVAMEGFTHLIPFAVGHEVLRQGIDDLTLIRMTPDVIYDQLIGMGAARRLVFSWGGNPGVGSLHRLRDAVEACWPHELELEEHSHGAMANRYVAGASSLPFALVRSYLGTDIAQHAPGVATVTCPFTGEELTAVSAINPDVTAIHAQVADRAGNVMLWGILGVQKEAALAARTVVVTVEEIVDTLPAQPGAVVLPAWVVDTISVVPGGCFPSYAQGYSDRDNDFYRHWASISADRDLFHRWMQRHVLDVTEFAEFLEIYRSTSPTEAGRR